MVMGKMKRLIVAGMLAVGLVAGLVGEANAGEAAEYSVLSEDTIAGTNRAVLARNDTQQPEIVTLDNFDTSDIADEEAKRRNGVAFPRTKYIIV